MALTRASHFIAHSSHVTCVRFGRKSDQMVATGGEDNIVNIWCLSGIKKTHGVTKTQRLVGHCSPVRSIGFNPSEHKLVAGFQSGSIQVFDREAGTENQVLPGHTAAVTTVDSHLYGNYVASGAGDARVKVWDLRTRNCMQTFQGHASQVTAVRFTPDGRWLTSGDQDGVIRIWDLTAGRLLHDFPHHVGAITSLEFNPDELILVSSAADRTIRFWDVQEFALIGVTPVDKATTTSMCHTIAEPYSGKYLLCCSQDAIRVWSYETAIESHDSIAIPRSKEPGQVSLHADTTMTQDMKLMSGCIQDASVSVWELDVMQMRPFDRLGNKNNDQRAGEIRSSSNRSPSARAVTSSDPAPSNQSAAAAATSASVLDVPLPVSRGPAHEVYDGVTRATALVIGDQTSCDFNHLDAISPATPEAFVPLTGANSISRPVRRAEEDPSQSVDVNVRINAPKDLAPQQPEGSSETHEPAVPARSRHCDDELVTSDFVMELRCGMDTCMKAFKARQKHIQQLLVHWEKGRLNDGLRYLGGLPKGKREAVVVDVLRITDLQSLGVDLEACVLLLPLIVEVLESNFELYLIVGVEAGHKLLNAFSSIVKDSRDVRQYRSRTIDFAGEERAQWYKACDTCFQEMQQRVQYLAETCNSSALQCKVHDLARALHHFNT